MRRWTEHTKLRESDRAQQEAEAELRKEVDAANPSADPLSGPLSEEQKQEVKARAGAKFDAVLQAKYEQVVAKARLLLTLQVPAALRKKQTNRTPSNSDSQQTDVTAAKRSKTLLMGYKQGFNDSECDWRDRLREWKHVQTSMGNVVDLAQDGLGA